MSMIRPLWGNPKPGGLLSDHLGARIFALGAYVGEVIRRQGAGQWRGDDNDPKGEINLAIQLKSGTIFWPMQRIMKRIKNGPEDGIYVYGYYNGSDTEFMEWGVQ